jgi:hypothetical protein
MKPSDFNPEKFDRGGKYTLYLELGPAAVSVR